MVSMRFGALWNPSHTVGLGGDCRLWENTNLHISYAIVLRSCGQLAVISVKMGTSHLLAYTWYDIYRINGKNSELRNSYYVEKNQIK